MFLRKWRHRRRQGALHDEDLKRAKVFANAGRVVVIVVAALTFDINQEKSFDDDVCSSYWWTKTANKPSLQESVCTSQTHLSHHQRVG